MQLTLKSQAVQTSIGGAPKIVSMLATEAPEIPRVFVGNGAPSGSSLTAGNAKFNSGKNGWLSALSLGFGGAGYVAGTTLTLTGTGGTGTPIQIKIDAVDANGVITDFHITRIGNYSGASGVYPANPIIDSTATTPSSFNIIFPPPDLYIDISNPSTPAMYVCTTSGSSSTSVWAKISGGGGGSFRGEYNPASAYFPQDTVVIRAGSNAGSYVCIAPASGSVAPVLPDTGNAFWLSLSGNAPSLGSWMS